MFQNHAALVPACDEEYERSLLPSVGQLVSGRGAERVIKPHLVVGAVVGEPESFLAMARRVVVSGLARLFERSFHFGHQACADRLLKCGRQHHQTRFVFVELYKTG